MRRSGSNTSAMTSPILLHVARGDRHLDRLCASRSRAIEKESPQVLALRGFGGQVELAASAPNKKQYRRATLQSRLLHEVIDVRRAAHIAPLHLLDDVAGPQTQTSGKAALGQVDDGHAPHVAGKGQLPTQMFRQRGELH